MIAKNTFETDLERCQTADQAPSACDTKKEGQHMGWPFEAFLLSHIKAPAQGGKAGSSKLPGGNLTKNMNDFKVIRGLKQQTGRVVKYVITHFSYNKSRK
jgi:hypothetical protein